jgi:hypothetical protein
MNEIPPLDQVRAEVRTGLHSKLPGLPAEVVDWASRLVSDVVGKRATESSDDITPTFCKEVEKALRAGDENAILLAMASVRKVAE